MAMTDQIHIKDLLLRTIIGINEEERHNRQDVLINVILYADTRAAGASDDIEYAVNYRTLTKRITSLVEGSQFCLVEKMAAEIAAICLDDPRVERVRVRVEKPGALRFARSVGVEIERSRAEMHRTRRVFVSLGSNIDAEQNLREAVRRLARCTHRSHCRLLAVSPVYETQPVGKTDRPDFLNAAALIETDLPAAELKSQVLSAIEAELGRVRTADKNAPRTIDLGISLYDDQVLDIGRRHIPDPDILQFAHIAQSLADLAPEYRHPETGQTLLEVARAVRDGGLIRRTGLALWPISP
jgi:dihydroneopterin aldolase/2-amino-4-hydroxy-6-hydroxymethyldihydropteridine diphosphokinase